MGGQPAPVSSGKLREQTTHSPFTAVGGARPSWHLVRNVDDSGVTCHSCVLHSTWGSSGDTPGADILTPIPSQANTQLLPRNQGKQEGTSHPSVGPASCPGPGASKSGPGQAGSSPSPVG